MCNLNLVYAVGVDSRVGRANVKEFAYMMDYGSVSNPDAWGFFTDSGLLMKDSGEFSLKRFNKMKPACMEAKFIIGHNRLATHGKAHDNNNNHPFTSTRFTWAHNGIISNYDEINKKYKLKYKGDVDSGIIGLALEKIIKKKKCNVPKAIKILAEELCGSFSIFVYDKSKEKLYYFKNSHTSFTFALVDKKYIFGATDKSNMRMLANKYELGFWLRSRSKKYQDAEAETVYEITDKGLTIATFFKEKEWSWSGSKSFGTGYSRSGYGYYSDSRWGYVYGDEDDEKTYDKLDDLINEGNDILATNGDSSYFTLTKRGNQVRLEGSSTLMDNLGITETCWSPKRFEEIVWNLEEYGYWEGN